MTIWEHALQGQDYAASPLYFFFFKQKTAYELDAASHNSVDDVRQINDAIRYAPVSARYKVYILDEVHMLSTQAFNALLKTLEEPPPHAKFIFATTEIRKVPITILSRCQ